MKSVKPSLIYFAWCVAASIWLLPVDIQFHYKIIVILVVPYAVLQLGILARYIYCGIVGIGNGAIYLWPFVLHAELTKRPKIMINPDMLYRYTVSRKVINAYILPQEHDNAIILSKYKKGIIIQLTAKLLLVLVVFIYSVVLHNVGLSFICIFSVGVLILLGQVRSEDYIGEIELYHELDDIDGLYCRNFFSEQISLYFPKSETYANSIIRILPPCEYADAHAATAIYHLLLSQYSGVYTYNPQLNEYVHQCVTAWMKDIIPASLQWYTICTYLIFCINQNRQKDVDFIMQSITKEIQQTQSNFPLKGIAGLKTELLEKAIKIGKGGKKYFSEAVKPRDIMLYRGFYSRLSDDYAIAYKELYSKITRNKDSHHESD